MAGPNEDKTRFPRLLICEGYEDHSFFQRLIHVRDLPRFHIWSAGGRSQFSEKIAAFRVERPKSYRALTDILIVADNDEDPAESFRNVRTHIERHIGLGTAPAAPLIRSNTMPRMTALMIPWEKQKGHLERLCMDAARSQENTMGVNVDAFLAACRADTWNNESRYGKAWLRSNLAVNCPRDPFIPLGDVFKKPAHHNLIPVTHNSFDRIANFLGTFS